MRLGKWSERIVELHLILELGLIVELNQCPHAVTKVLKYLGEL